MMRAGWSSPKNQHGIGEALPEDRKSYGQKLADRGLATGTVFFVAETHVHVVGKMMRITQTMLSLPDTMAFSNEKIFLTVKPFSRSPGEWSRASQPMSWFPKRRTPTQRPWCVTRRPWAKAIIKLLQNPDFRQWPILTMVLVISTMVFVAPTMAFDAGKMFSSLETIFSKAEKAVAVPGIMFPAVETLVSTIKAVVFLFGTTVRGTKTLFSEAEPVVGASETDFSITEKTVGEVPAAFL